MEQLIEKVKKNGKRTVFQKVFGLNKIDYFSEGEGHGDKRRDTSSNKSNQ